MRLMHPFSRAQAERVVDEYRKKGISLKMERHPSAKGKYRIEIIDEGFIGEIEAYLGGYGVKVQDGRVHGWKNCPTSEWRRFDTKIGTKREGL